MRARYEDVPLLTKADLRPRRPRRPPFGEHLCAPAEALVRLHVTSGTTGDPVAIGLTRADHGELGHRRRGLRRRRARQRRHRPLPELRALHGGIADHVGADLLGRDGRPGGRGPVAACSTSSPLGLTAIYGTLSFPAHLAGRAREAGLDRAELGLRHIVTAGEPGAGLGAVRRSRPPGLPRWPTASASTTCYRQAIARRMPEHTQGLHSAAADGWAILELVEPGTGAPLRLEDDAFGELVWTHLRREASPLLRYRFRATSLAWTSPCACGRSGVRIRIEGRVDDMLRVQAVNVHPGAIGAVLGRFEGLGRYAVVADGDPIVPPLRVLVETANGIEGVDAALRAELIASRLPGRGAGDAAGGWSRRRASCTARREERRSSATPLPNPHDTAGTIRRGAPWA